MLLHRLGYHGGTMPTINLFLKTFSNETNVLIPRSNLTTREINTDRSILFWSSLNNVTPDYQRIFLCACLSHLHPDIFDPTNKEAGHAILLVADKASNQIHMYDISNEYKLNSLVDADVGEAFQKALNSSKIPHISQYKWTTSWIPAPSSGICGSTISTVDCGICLLLRYK